MQVAVSGPTGFVGSALVGALADAGHVVTPLTRRPAQYRGVGAPRAFDIGDPSTVRAALDGQDAAYYLVHSLAEVDFSVSDRRRAEAFASAASDAGLTQVVHLGGHGDSADDLSEHLRSRREVESILLAGAPATALRAGLVIGDGGISWEILRQLVERLPVMVTPRWVQTRTQPIALADALAALVGALGRSEAVDQTYEIGGPEVLTYRSMMVIAARVMRRRRLILPVPLLSPGLSSHWLRLVTDVDIQTARSLVDSMTNEVIVHDRRIAGLVGPANTTFAAAVEQALAARAARLDVETRPSAAG